MKAKPVKNASFSGHSELETGLLILGRTIVLKRRSISDRRSYPSSLRSVLGICGDLLLITLIAN